METGNETETEVTDPKPDDAVVAETETTESIPQDEASEEEELYVDVEGDQEKPKTNMSQEQAYAAFRKEQEKRKRKNELLEAEKAASEKLQKKVEELESKITTITRGSEPTLESCDYDEEEFRKQLRDYYQAQPTKQESKEESQQEPQQTTNEEADFYLFQKEQELSKAMPNYQDSKSKVAKAFIEKFNVPSDGVDMVMSQLSYVASQTGVDIAKAIVAMGEIPSLIDELNTASSNQFAVSRLLEKAAGSVKTRSKKPIDTAPTPDINNSGPLSNVEAEVKKAKEAWQKDSSTANYNRYKAAKRKVKNDG